MMKLIKSTLVLGLMASSAMAFDMSQERMVAMDDSQVVAAETMGANKPATETLRNVAAVLNKSKMSTDDKAAFLEEMQNTGAFDGAPVGTDASGRLHFIGDGHGHSAWTFVN